MLSRSVDFSYQEKNIGNKLDSILEEIESQSPNFDKILTLFDSLNKNIYSEYDYQNKNYWIEGLKRLSEDDKNVSREEKKTIALKLYSLALEKFKPKESIAFVARPFVTFQKVGLPISFNDSPFALAHEERRLFNNEQNNFWNKYLTEERLEVLRHILEFDGEEEKEMANLLIRSYLKVAELNGHLDCEGDIKRIKENIEREVQFIDTIKNYLNVEISSEVLLLYKESCLFKEVRNLDNHKEEEENEIFNEFYEDIQKFFSNLEGILNSKDPLKIKIKKIRKLIGTERNRISGFISKKFQGGKDKSLGKEGGPNVRLYEGFFNFLSSLEIEIKKEGKENQKDRKKTNKKREGRTDLSDIVNEYQKNFFREFYQVVSEVRETNLDVYEESLRVELKEGLETDMAIYFFRKRGFVRNKIMIGKENSREMNFVIEENEIYQKIKEYLEGGKEKLDIKVVEWLKNNFPSLEGKEIDNELLKKIQEIFLMSRMDIIPIISDYNNFSDDKEGLNFHGDIDFDDILNLFLDKYFRNCKSLEGFEFCSLDKVFEIFKIEENKEKKLFGTILNQSYEWLVLSGGERHRGFFDKVDDYINNGHKYVEFFPYSVIYFYLYEKHQKEKASLEEIKDGIKIFNRFIGIYLSFNELHNRYSKINMWEKLSHKNVFFDLANKEIADLNKYIKDNDSKEDDSYYKFDFLGEELSLEEAMLQLKKIREEIDKINNPILDRGVEPIPINLNEEGQIIYKKKPKGKPTYERGLTASEGELEKVKRFNDFLHQFNDVLQECKSQELKELRAICKKYQKDFCSSKGVKIEQNMYSFLDGLKPYKPIIIID